jgi:hypothetical protein
MLAKIFSPLGLAARRQQNLALSANAEAVWAAMREAKAR